MSDADQQRRRDHDQRLKMLLRLFLPQFFECFLPEWFERIDFSHGVEFLEQEVFAHPPEGPRRTVDLVVKVRLKAPHLGSAECLAIPSSVGT